MLQRSSQIGEYYRMAPPKSFAMKKKPDGTTDGPDLPPHYMDIVIYDEEMDKHMHITVREAMRAAMQDKTHMSAAEADPKKKGLNFFGDKALIEQKYKEVGVTKKTLAVDNAGLDADAIAEALTKGEWHPVEIVIARPFIEHLMMSAVVAVAGRDTGATLFGPADMQISANTSVKTIEGTYTFHTKSVVTKPQNVMVLRDIMCSGYVAGGNTRFFGEKKAKASADGKYKTSEIIEAITDRLSFADDASGEYESMLAFAVPLDSNAKRDQVMSLSARLLPWEVTNSAQTHDYFPGGDLHYKYYSTAYQLNTIHFGEDIRAAENQEFISNVSHALSRTHPDSQTPRLPDSQTPTHPNPLRRIATSAGLRQQLALLRGPAPRVLAVVVDLLRALAGQGPLRPRRHPRRRSLAPRRGRLPRFGSQLNGLARGCCALAARLPEAQLSATRERNYARGVTKRL